MANKKIKTVGAAKAQSHFGKLLTQVKQDGEVVITKRNRPIARVVFIPPPPTKKQLKEAFDRLRELRAKISIKLKPGEAKELVAFGRRI